LADSTLSAAGRQYADIATVDPQHEWDLFAALPRDVGRSVLSKLAGFAKWSLFGIAEAFCDATRRPEIERTLNQKSKEIGSGEVGHLQVRPPMPTWSNSNGWIGPS